MHDAPEEPVRFARDPYRESFRMEHTGGFPKQPEFTALRKTCKAAKTEIRSPLVDEMTGLTVPSGVRAGVSHFASAHELVLAFATAAITPAGRAH